MNAWHRAGRSIGRRVAALATLILLIGGRLYQDGGIPLPPYYLG